MIVVLIISGGADSTISLNWAKKKWDDPDGQYANMHALSFNYGQKHSRELACAGDIARKHGMPHTVIPLTQLLGTSPLVGGSELGIYEKPEDLPGGIEPTFIPCRNIVFLTYAANYAMANDKRENGRPEINLVTGVCEADFGGYPDCRQVFIDDMATALNTGIFGEVPDERQAEPGFVKIHTPLMNLTKKQSVQLAKDLGCLDDLALTHTCYSGSVLPCRKCHACIIRERGFVEAGIPDPLIIRHKLSWPPQWAMRQVQE